MWVIVSFIAIALGIIMFSGIQGDIPDELGWLKAKPKGSIVVQGLPEQTGENGKSANVQDKGSPVFVPQPMNIPGGWVYQAIGKRDFTVTKDMKGSFPANPNYDPPQFSVVCASGKVYVTLLPLLSVKQDSQKLATVDLNGKPFKFSMTENLRLFAPNTEEVLGSLNKGAPLTIGFDYQEFGSLSFKVTSEGMREATSFVNSRCGQ